MLTMNNKIKQEPMAKSQDAPQLKSAKEVSFLGLCEGILPDPLFIHNKDGLIIEVNQSICDYTGYTKAELSLMTTFDIELENDSQNTQAAFERTEPGITRIKSGTCFRKDGTTFPVEVHRRPVDADGRRLYVCTIHDITEQKDTERAFRESEERFRLAMESVSDGLWDWNISEDRTYFSPAFFRILGYQPGEIHLDGRFWASRIHPEDKARVIGTLKTYVADGGAALALEYRMQTKDGQWIWVLGRGGVVERDAQGRAVRLTGTNVDITERKLNEFNLRLAANVFTFAREGITITDRQGNIVEVNETFTRITGYKREEVLGKNPRILKSGRQGEEFYQNMWKTLLDKGYWSGEVWNRRKNGEIYPETLTISAVRDADGTPQHFVGLFADITSIKEHQHQLERIAHYDALTNLPNRLLLADRLRQGIAQSQRRGRSLAVAYLDLDGFKEVNDRHGHEAGDELLIEISKRMKAVLREGDTLARIGGDEFVAVLVDLDGLDDAYPILDRLLEAASEPVTIHHLTIAVSASIGITLCPQDGVEADQLLRHADQAMYQAKQAGKNRHHMFDVTHDQALKAQNETVSGIRRALESGEMVLYYQPKVNIKTGEVIGAEALIRWQHPDKGLLLPAAFLPVIEDHPLSVPLGEWVIVTALSQLETWLEAGFDMTVSVNVGARLLQQSDFVSRLSGLLATHPKVPPALLELEILETSLLAELTVITERMRACQKVGVRFALDDFGTGYSSLTYLRHLPAELIKIDQTFVRDMLIDPEDLAIVSGVVGLASAFRRQVIAEGVETEAHGAQLLELNCQLAQGYGIAKPMPADRFLSWLQNWRQDMKWETPENQE